MASRLTRWSMVAALALAAAMIALLPPGVSPLALYYYPRSTAPSDPLDEQLATTKLALDRASYDLYHAVAERRIAGFAPRGREPVVVITLHDTVQVDPVLTRFADSIWRGVAPDPRAPRTLLVGSLFGSSGTGSPADPTLCTGALVMLRRTALGRTLAVVAGAGGCLLATEFGPPGRGLDRWLSSVGSFYLPGRVPRAEAKIPVLVPVQDVWIPGFNEPVDRLPWWTSPAMDACAAGRGSYCAEALGFGVAGLDSFQRWDRLALTSTLLSKLPGTLLEELGPERFRALWLSDEPLPVAYARVTGRSFDDWALDFVQHRVGRLAKDNVLSWGGWAGWVLWMGLLFAWFAVRLREQPAQ